MLPIVFLGIVLFVKTQAVLLGIFCLIGAVMFLRGYYANLIEESKVVYRTFYMLRQEVS